MPSSQVLRLLQHPRRPNFVCVPHHAGQIDQLLRLLCPSVVPLCADDQLLHAGLVSSHVLLCGGLDPAQSEATHVRACGIHLRDGARLSESLAQGQYWPSHSRLCERLPSGQPRLFESPGPDQCVRTRSRPSGHLSLDRAPLFEDPVRRLHGVMKSPQHGPLLGGQLPGYVLLFGNPSLSDRPTCAFALLPCWCLFEHLVQTLVCLSGGDRGYHGQLIGVHFLHCDLLFQGQLREHAHLSSDLLRGP